MKGRHHGAFQYRSSVRWPFIVVITTTARAEQDFTDVWQPQGRTATFFGTLQVPTDGIIVGGDGKGTYEPVRPAGAVFRVQSIEGDMFQVCGNTLPTYIGYRVLGDGSLALLL